MQMQSRQFLALSILGVLLVLLSGWNTYQIWQLKKGYGNLAERAYVDRNIDSVSSWISSWVSDIGVRVNDLQYPPREERSASTSTQENLFIKENIRVGDTVVGMRVTSSTRRFTYFQGRTTVRGNVSFNDDPETAAFMLGTVCFDVIEEDWHKLPRIINDNRNVWFCFSNDAQARRLLRNVTGQIAITIDRYVIDSMESSVWNEAELVRVDR